MPLSDVSRHFFLSLSVVFFISYKLSVFLILYSLFRPTYVCRIARKCVLCGLHTWDELLSYV
ncbi:hypothetical protein HMPREF9446_00915 [Bacteroides fluxus YIT 12057]|uniref:Uncharacterized protein n=1 Tax=Bacteroides fluxus YIT 12057 TaxID=763034 RepID=F3PQC2_9BACE|nr:hypothetical protein HMPREF9446_00915 [Bacteroides fluxus YIT 12057]